ncbi:MAG: AAA family ATPase [Thaumarchaeota archaeon]|nr:AAA family ATPase [Nitrososphaerota archaeon]
MAEILGITGTPGTGKKSVAPLVAEALGRKLLGLNELARAHGLLERTADESEVDTEELRKKLRESDLGPALVFGHLLPYVFEKGSLERVVVLRCEPSVLKGRLAARGYPRTKVLDNVEAELIGLVSSDAHDAFGKDRTFELDTTRSTPAQAARKAALILGGKPGSAARIDWTRTYGSGAKLRSLLSVP